MSRFLKVTSAIACAAGLTACDRNLSGAILPAPPPNAPMVAANGETIARAWSQMRSVVSAQSQTNPWPSSHPDLDVRTAQYFVMTGYSLAQDNCQTFFDKNRLLRSQTSFAKDTLVAIGTAAGTIAGLAGATAQVLTAVLGTTGIIPTGIDSFNKTFLNAEIADTVQPMVVTGMEEYRKANPPENATTLTAVDMVRGYAQLCTLGSMLDITRIALNNVKVTAGSLTGSSEPTPEAASATARSGAPFSSRFALPGGTATTTAPPKRTLLGRNGSYYYYSDR